MSRWIHLDGMLKGVKKDLSGIKTPTGSEGDATLAPLGTKFPGTWFIDGDLRDRDEDDARDIRDWFVSLCADAQPAEADLCIDVESGGRYVFTWKDGLLDLEIPPLYREWLKSDK